MARPVDIMIAGAQKAGTTSLDRYLENHSRLITHPNLEFAYFIGPDNWSSYEEAYNASFPRPPQADELVLAKSVGIMVLPRAAQALYDHNPDVKIITMLREPVSRAYSAYWFQVSVGRQPKNQSFEEALSTESERLSADFSSEHHTAYYYRGLYADQLKMLHGIFGREQVYSIVMDDLTADPDRVLSELFQWLGIEDEDLVGTNERHNQRSRVRSQTLAKLIRSPYLKRAKRLIPAKTKTRMNSLLQKMNKSAKEIPAIDPDTAKRLAQRFVAPNQELRELIGHPLSSW